MRLKIDEILKVTGGKLLCGDADTAVTSFAIDSRQIKSGTMFVPIKGEKTDSHIYIDDVLETGAATFTEEEIPAKNKPVVLVKDSRLALQKSAGYYRSQFSIPVIGVTGSVGKTTAKEMIALALSGKLKVMKTAGNANSQVGVPLTICNLKKEHEAAVVEMGVSMPGEMARIAEVVKPTHAVMMNIGVSHIEYLKSRENIMAEKLHIADYLRDNGILFVNGDDDLLMTLKENIKDKVVTFGVNQDCDCRAYDLRSVDKGTFFTYEFKGEKAEVFVPAAGLHNVRNALASIAVARTLDVSSEDVIRAIGAYKPPEMRQEIIKASGIKIIDDSYNSSPDSAKAAIDILAESTESGRKIAVLADMLELGDYSEKGHFEVGAYAAKSKVDLVVCVGEESKATCEGFGGNHKWYMSREEAISYLKDELKSGDTVLIKGSRGMKMEEITAELSAYYK